MDDGSQTRIDRLLAEALEAAASSQWHAVRDTALAVLAIDQKNAEATWLLRLAEDRESKLRSDRGAAPDLSLPDTPQGWPAEDPLLRRIARLRLTVGLILAGFLLNAGVVLLPVVLIGGSVQVALGAVTAMALVIILAALFGQFFLLSVSGARPLLPGEFPWLTPMMDDLSRRAGLDTPKILVSPEGSLNAFTTGTGRGARVVFYRALLEELPRNEVEAVAAHELGHVLNRDISLAVWTHAVFWWVLLVHGFALLVVQMLIAFVKGIFDTGEEWSPIVGLIVAALAYPLAALIWVVSNMWAFVAQLMILAITRQREYLADATAIGLTGQPTVFASALARMAESPSIERGEKVIGGFCIMSPSLRRGWLEDFTSTHPAPERRMEEALKLPPRRRAFDERWRGAGSSSILLPAGAVTSLALLALAIPLLAGGSNSSSTFTTPVEQAGKPSSGGEPSQAVTSATPSRRTGPSADEREVEPTATPVPRPSETPVPTATPPPPGTILYEANWSAGSEGWPNLGGWQASSGLFLSDGSGESGSDWVAAPYRPGDHGIANYAVEAEVQLVSVGAYDCAGFGIVVRDHYGAGTFVDGSTVDCGADGKRAGFFVIAVGEGRIDEREATVDREFHTYRAEITGNRLRLFFDGALVLETLDNRYLDGGGVGLWSAKAQLTVRSFRITAE